MYGRTNDIHHVDIKIQRTKPNYPLIEYPIYCKLSPTESSYFLTQLVNETINQNHQDQGKQTEKSTKLIETLVQLVS
jgi:hypothetical protein